jgi:hypothetical protein
MRQALVNANPDLAAANAKYVMRITGDNDESKAQLDNFINEDYGKLFFTIMDSLPIQPRARFAQAAKAQSDMNQSIR